MPGTKSHINTPQPGILLPIPPLARYLTFSLKPGVNPREPLRGLRTVADGDRVVAIGKKTRTRRQGSGRK